MPQDGDTREIVVAAKLMEMGYVVSKPLSDNERYDLVVEVDNELLKIQVKTAHTRTNDQNSIMSRLRRQTRNGRVPYDEEDVDIFVLYHRDTGDIYWIPFDECAATSVSLAVRENKHSQVKRDAEDYLITEKLK